MRVLLDTHALLWWLDDNARLGPKARAVIADRNNTIHVSVVSFWEIVIKARIGKLTADVNDVWAGMAQSGFTPLGIDLPHLTALQHLQAAHKDPFDHLLLAQALSEGMAFVSEDRHAALYPVQVVSCSG